MEYLMKRKLFKEAEEMVTNLFNRFISEINLFCDCKLHVVLKLDKKDSLMGMGVGNYIRVNLYNIFENSVNDNLKMQSGEYHINKKFLNNFIRKVFLNSVIYILFDEMFYSVQNLYEYKSIYNDIRTYKVYTFLYDNLDEVNSIINDKEIIDKDFLYSYFVEKNHLNKYEFKVVQSISEYINYNLFRFFRVFRINPFKGYDEDKLKNILLYFYNKEKLIENHCYIKKDNEWVNNKEALNYFNNMVCKTLYDHHDTKKSSFNYIDDDNFEIISTINENLAIYVEEK